MAAIRFMLLISIFGHHIEAEERPVVTLDPNWNKIFRKESITLTCNVETTGERNQNYDWYKDNWLQRTHGPRIEITYAQMEHAGNYQCKYGDLPKSDSVHLDVSNDWLILQANYVYEGDTLVLRCHGWDSLFGYRAWFYKDDILLYSTDSVFQQKNIVTGAGGKYRCERRRIFTDTAETYVTVYELFSEPALKLIKPLVMEGDAMTLECDTSLPLLRKNTKLQFAFYRDGWNVQEFSVSDTYRVTSVQVKDSGKYTCQVRTESYTVKKSSKDLSVQIQALFSEPTLILDQSHVTEADDITLKCDTVLAPSKKNTELQFAFYREGRTAQTFSVSDTYRARQVRMEDSGNYACEVKTGDGAVRKKSKNVFIQIKAAFGQTQFKLSADEVVVGDDIVLSCESTMSSLPIRYTFYHNGTSMCNITVHQKEAAVKRLNVKSPTMAGSYYCISDNGIAKQRQLSNMVFLLVIDPVSRVNTVLDKAGENFVLGVSLTFRCSVERGTSPSFSWLHNGKLVDKDSRFYVLIDHGKVLYINSLRYHHAGSYQCKVSNKVSTNRTFSVVSDIRTINILEQSPVGESSSTADDDPTDPETSSLWSLLGVLVLVVALSGVLVFYRHKVCSILPWFQQQTKPGATFDRVRPRVGPTGTRDAAPKPDSTHIAQEDYTNIPNMAHCAADDVCYSHIQINRLQGSTDNIRGQDEFSVTYSAVKCSGTKMNGTQTVGNTELYENIHSKES